MTMKSIRIAGIGSYGHYPAVLRELAPLPGCRLTGWAPAVDGDVPAGWQVAGGPSDEVRVYDQVESLLADTTPDVVIVSARLDRIAPSVRLAAEAGCAVICEKPLALSTRELDELYAVVKRKQVPVCAMLSMRATPPIQAARDAVQAGLIGTPVLLNSWKSYKWGDHRPEWYGQRAYYGGTIPWVGIHALDMIRFTSGLAFKRVGGMHGNVHRPERPECEDHATLMLELTGGAHATAQLDYYRPPTAQAHGEHGIRIVGTEGELYADVTRGTCQVQVAADAEPRLLPLPPKALLYRSFTEKWLHRETFTSAEIAEPFVLTAAALRARDAADRGVLLPVDEERWVGV